jgi:hypothetical protein
MKKYPALALFAFLLLSLTGLYAQQLQHPVAQSSNSNTLVTRSPDSRGWTDPALNHNRLLQQQSSDGNYKLIGPYKVVGSQYLFGEHHKADMFTREASAYNIFISYNTFNQEVEFYSTSNPNTPLVREPGTVDSFTIHSNTEMGIAKNLRFIYSAVMGGKEKFFYQEVYIGTQYKLYKRYKSELGYVGTNLAQSELRQFDLLVDYYYSTPDSKGLKKIKANAPSVIKEFKEVKDLSTVVTTDMFTMNPEEAFGKAFAFLNGQ